MLKNTLFVFVSPWLGKVSAPFYAAATGGFSPAVLPLSYARFYLCRVYRSGRAYFGRAYSGFAIIALPFVFMIGLSVPSLATTVTITDTYNIDRLGLVTRGGENIADPPDVYGNGNGEGAAFGGSEISVISVENSGARSNSSHIFRYRNRSYSVWEILPPRPSTVRPNFYTEKEVLLNISLVGLVEGGIVVYGSNGGSGNNYLLLVKPSGDTLVIADYIIVNWGQYNKDITLSLSSIDSPKNVLDYNGDGILDIIIDFTDLSVRANIQVGDGTLQFGRMPISTLLRPQNNAEERLYRDNEDLAYRFMRGEITYNDLVNIAGRLRINTYDESTLLQKVSTDTMAKLLANNIPASAIIEYMAGNVSVDSLRQAYGRSNADFIVDSSLRVQTLLYKLYVTRSAALLVYNEAMDLSDPKRVNLAIQSWGQNLARIQNTIPELLQYITSQDAIITTTTLRLKVVEQ